MSDNYSDRRASVRMPTEIQGKIDDESCYISNLSDGGAMLLSTFNGKVGQEVTIRFTFNQDFFEKKATIRASNSVSRVRTHTYKSSFMYAISVAFTESVTDRDFFSLTG
ncbi:MAG: PilZ domain-containing protein [Leptospiraceae bacterium]|nr:PilZ domain-containing protein [Leptospiraceae bacterium]